MKNKTKTYILITAVLGIWGLIGYKILNAVHPDESVESIVSADVSFKPKTSIKKDTFSIQLVDKDPFLGTLSKKKKVSVKKQTAIPANLENTPQPIIIYQGLIKNTSEQIFTVNINNQQFLLKKGQSVQDVTIIRGSSKELVVRFNGKLMTIPMQ